MKFTSTCACGKVYKTTGWRNKHQRSCAAYQLTISAQLSAISRRAFIPMLMDILTKPSLMVRNLLDK